MVMSPFGFLVFFKIKRYIGGKCKHLFLFGVPWEPHGGGFPGLSWEKAPFSPFE
jgi:hypothetical protein